MPPQAFGPTRVGVTCKTCGLKFRHCPGHMGHIELSVPVYNPLLFNHMFRLLRSKCWSCHRFKARPMHAATHRRRATRTVRDGRTELLNRPLLNCPAGDKA